MMEKFYDFLARFDFWMVMLPVMMLMMVVFGIGQWGMRRRKIYRFYSNKVFTRVAIVFAGIFGVLFFLESFREVSSWLDENSTEADSGAWPVILTPFAIVWFAGLIGFFLNAIGSITGTLRREYLYEKRKMMRKASRKKN